MYRVFRSKKEKKRNHDLKHTKRPFLVTNQIFVPLSLSCRAKQEKQEKKRLKCLKPNFPPDTPFPKKKFHLLLSCECASKIKRKRENPRSKIGGKQKKKRKPPIKDWRKARKRKKISDQRSKERKREIYRKIIGPDNV